MAEQELTPEQLLEQVRQLRVADVLLPAFSTVAQVAYVKLDASTRDLDEARLAIESLRALLPVLESAVERDTLRDYRQVVSNLQLAYADAAASATPFEAASGKEPQASEAAGAAAEASGKEPRAPAGADAPAAREAEPEGTPGAPAAEPPEAEADDAAPGATERPGDAEEAAGER